MMHLNDLDDLKDLNDLDDDIKEENIIRKNNGLKITTIIPEIRKCQHYYNTSTIDCWSTHFNIPNIQCFRKCTQLILRIFYDDFNDTILDLLMDNTTSLYPTSRHLQFPLFVIILFAKLLKKNITITNDYIDIPIINMGSNISIITIFYPFKMELLKVDGRTEKIDREKSYVYYFSEIKYTTCLIRSNIYFCTSYSINMIVFKFRKICTMNILEQPNISCITITSNMGVYKYYNDLDQIQRYDLDCASLYCITLKDFIKEMDYYIYAKEITNIDFDMDILNDDTVVDIAYICGW